MFRLGPVHSVHRTFDSRQQSLFQFSALIFGCAGSSRLPAAWPWLPRLGATLAVARELLVAAPSLMAGTSGSCTRTSGIVARGLGCCPGGGIFLDRGLNLCPLQTGRWILYCWTTGADLKRSLMIGYIFSPLQNAPGGFSGYTKRSLMFRPIQNRLVWTTPACGHFR